MKKSKDKILLQGMYKELEILLKDYDEATDKNVRETYVDIMSHYLTMINDVKTRRSESGHRTVSLIIDGVTKIGAVVLPACIYVSCFNRGLQFEETGVYKYEGTRNLSRKLSPNKF